MKHWHDTLIESDLSYFIGKTISTVDPGANYLPNWHIELIAEYLKATQLGDITRLIINMPPRSLKSVSVSVAWPAWLLGHCPKTRIIAASYASSLSIKHSVDCRLVINSSWYKRLFPEIKLARDQNEKHKFITMQRGFRIASSIGGSITGEGGNFLIVDDPISPAQAYNAHWRNHVNRWFDHTFSTRLDDKQKGAIIVVMQRLHANDLSGHLLSKGGWTHVCLPALSAKHLTMSIGPINKERKVDDVLHPARETKELIERAKLELGSEAFAAQYQQNPQNDKDAMVRLYWFPRYKHAPLHCDRKVQSWDTAIKCEDKHDASVCMTFGEWENKSYLLDVRLFKHEYPDLKRMLVLMAQQWQPQAILIEDKASGQQLLQDMRRETSLPVIATLPKGNKVTRFAAVSAMIEAGKVVLPENSSWLTDFENEIVSFPNGDNDDQVDALTQYLDWLRMSMWHKLRLRQI